MIHFPSDTPLYIVVATILGGGLLGIGLAECMDRYGSIFVSAPWIFTALAVFGAVVLLICIIMLIRIVFRS